MSLNAMMANESDLCILAHVPLFHNDDINPTTHALMRLCNLLDQRHTHDDTDRPTRRSGTHRQPLPAHRRRRHIHRHLGIPQYPINDMHHPIRKEDVRLDDPRRRRTRRHKVPARVPRHLEDLPGVGEDFTAEDRGVHVGAVDEL